MTSAALNLAETETYKQAVATAGGSVECHWILLLYRTIKDDISIRPFQLQSAQPGHLWSSRGGLHLAHPLAAKLVRP